MKPNKPLGIKNYGSIPHLPGSKLGKHDSYIHDGQARIMTEKFRDKYDYLIVTEKYDGTNVGVAKKNGQIIAIQRKGYDCKSSPYYPHKVFSEYVRERNLFFEKILNEGERIVGEWLYEASGIHYKINGSPFVAFDLFDINNKRYSYFDLLKRLGMNGVSVARLIHKGAPMKVDGLIQSLYKGTFSTLDGQKPEGLVFRIERKGVFDFMAKWVRPDFVPGRYLAGIGMPEGSGGIKNELNF